MTEPEKRNIMPHLPLTDWNPPATVLTDAQRDDMIAAIKNTENLAELAGVVKTFLSEFGGTIISLAAKAAL